MARLRSKLVCDIVVIKKHTSKPIQVVEMLLPKSSLDAYEPFVAFLDLAKKYFLQAVSKCTCIKERGEYVVTGEGNITDVTSLVALEPFTLL